MKGCQLKFVKRTLDRGMKQRIDVPRNPTTTACVSKRVHTLIMAEVVDCQGIFYASWQEVD
jgi:hypothetical protein